MKRNDGYKVLYRAVQCEAIPLTSIDQPGEFQFCEPGVLVDGDLELILALTCPTDPARGTVPEYQFVMTLHESGQPIGRVHLRIGRNEWTRLSGHVGYEVELAHRGHHYAARSCRLLFPLARHHGINPIVITCDPDNIASRRTCELLGGRLQDIVPLPGTHPMDATGAHLRCRYFIDV